MKKLEEDLLKKVEKIKEVEGKLMEAKDEGAKMEERIKSMQGQIDYMVKANENNAKGGNLPEIMADYTDFVTVNLDLKTLF